MRNASSSTTAAASNAGFCHSGGGAPGYQGYDAFVSKAFTVYREQHLEFRGDASNVLNLTALSNPNDTARSATFGQTTSVRSGPRKLQPEEDLCGEYYSDLAAANRPMNGFADRRNWHFWSRANDKK
jgi:hypothetical protein